MFNFFKKTADPANTQKLELKLSGLHCTSCAVDIDLTLEDLPGVLDSKTSFARLTSSIKFDPEKITPQKITAEIKKLGYTCQVVA